MIRPGTQFRVARIPLDRIVVTMTRRRSPTRLDHYRRQLLAHPDEDVLIHLAPCGDDRQHLYRVLDGHHRFLASLMAGRPDVLAVIETEPHQHERD